MLQRRTDIIKEVRDASISDSNKIVHADGRSLKSDPDKFNSIYR